MKNRYAATVNAGRRRTCTLLCAAVLLAAGLLASPSPARAQSVLFDAKMTGAPADGEVTIAVSVEDFVDVTGFQFSLAWDAAALDFVEAGSFGIRGMNEGAIGEPEEGTPSSDRLTVAWDDPEGESLTVEDGTVLFEVTYAYTGSLSGVEVVFADKPTPRMVFVNREDAEFRSSATPLPVELSGFEAAVEGRDVLLAWTTLGETNNLGFEVQQQVEGRFQRVGYEKGAGTTTERQRYAHRVRSVAPGCHRFRLKQMDADGTSALSQVVEVMVTDVTARGMTGARPNPFRAQTSFALTLGTPQRVRVDVFNVLGQRVARLHDDALSAGTPHRFTLDAQDLASGLYIIRAHGKGLQDTQTVTLVR